MPTQTTINNPVNTDLEKLRAELEPLVSQWITDGMTQVQLHDMILNWNSQHGELLLASELMEIAATAWEKAKNRETVTDELIKIIEGEKKKTQTQAEWLLKIADKLNLFHDQHKQPFTFLNGETVPLSSNKVKDYLSYEFYKKEKKAVNSDSINQALGVLKGKALFENPEIQLSNRIAEKDGALYYDLLNKKAVKITPGKWEIVINGPNDKPFWKSLPILFRRYAHQQAQVEPIRGGDPWGVFDFLNIKGDNHLLVLVYIISCFVPDIPHPIFHPYGAQGAGKTTLCNIIKKLCDPSIISAIVSPRDAAQLIQVLAHHHVSLFDNMSDLPAWMSDILAMACTGSGFSKRQLYSDDEDVTYQIKRCIGLNGINTLISRADIMDRTILLHLERIEPSKRIAEKSLWESFEQQKPYILGGIFDALATAMAIYPSIKAESLFRMADFTKWGISTTKALGKNPNDFIQAYQANIAKQNEEVILNSALAQAVLQFMNEKEKWVGTIKEVFAFLIEIAKPEKGDNSFPKAEKSLRRYLNRLKTNLMDVGITFEIGQRTGGRVPITFQRVLQDGSFEFLGQERVTQMTKMTQIWKGVGVETPCSGCMLTPAMRGACEVVKPCPQGHKEV